MNKSNNNFFQKMFKLFEMNENPIHMTCSVAAILRTKHAAEKDIFV